MFDANRQQLFQVLLYLCVGSVEAKDLCRPDEEVFFSCKVEQSEKIASVCGVVADQAATTLQYRFGTPRRVELAFPQAEKDSVSRFQLERANSNYGNGGGQYYHDLFFRSGTFYYSVLSGRHSREDGEYVDDHEISVFASDP